VVSTPLGNASDLSDRAKSLLAEVDCVYCEDTRTSGRLLRYLGIEAKELRSLHAHNEHQRIDEIVTRIERGAKIALVSDAGTPGISDPGTELIAHAHDANLRVSPIPGASALSAALSVSGFPARGLEFAGFLPKAKGARARALSHRLKDGVTLVCFVPARDVLVTVEEVAEQAPDSLILLCREMTKKFEEVVRLCALDMVEHLKEHDNLKGEIVLTIHCPSSKRDAGEPEFTAALQSATQIMLDGGLSKRDTQRALAALTGHPKNQVLKWVLQIKEQS